jgi:hypothetical protein
MARPRIPCIAIKLLPIKNERLGSVEGEHNSRGKPMPSTYVGAE